MAKKSSAVSVSDDSAPTVAAPASQTSLVAEKTDELPAEVKKEETSVVDGVKVAEAIAAIFDKRKGQILTTDFLVSKCAGDIDDSGSFFEEYKKAATKYLQVNVGAKGEALFGRSKGQGGGTWRWSDCEGRTKKEEAKEVFPLEGLSEEQLRSLRNAVNARLRLIEENKKKST